MAHISTFEFCWSQIAQGLVPSLTVVKYFYVPEDIFVGIFLCSVLFVIKHFAFYCTEKGFCTSVVVAIAFTAHTANYPMFLEKSLVLFAAILHTPIRVVNQPLCLMIAFLRAFKQSSVLMLSAVAHPTISFVNISLTVARYSQPSQVTI